MIILLRLSRYPSAQLIGQSCLIFLLHHLILRTGRNNVVFVFAARNMHTPPPAFRSSILPGLWGAGRGSSLERISIKEERQCPLWVESWEFSRKTYYDDFVFTWEEILGNIWMYEFYRMDFFLLNFIFKAFNQHQNCVNLVLTEFQAFILFFHISNGFGTTQKG